MVFDIDNFKSYNDLYGHEAGDEVLCETVGLLRATIRRGDHVFRIGGDEFVVISAIADPLVVLFARILATSSWPVSALRSTARANHFDNPSLS